MNILLITSSIHGEQSQSSRLALQIVNRLRAGRPAATLRRRDLAANPHPALDAFALQALLTPAAERSPQQSQRVALDDALIAEVQAAEYLVLGVPMYNFGVPSQLKNWIDAIARARVTFRYTEQGVEGLLKDKTVFAALTRGGHFRDTPADAQVPYLRAVLGFLGMTDVRFVYAEGLALGQEAEQNAFRDAQLQLEAALA